MADQPDVDALVWRSSSRCNNGNMVEVALLPDEQVGVRDSSKDAKDSPVLKFSTADWIQFIAKLGEGR